MCNVGQASMCYFYFDFRDISKQHRRDLLTSFLFQLSSRSGPCGYILSRLYAAYDSGTRQPSDQDLTTCLNEMLTVSDQCQIYLIIDALDESPDTSGIPCPREQVLQLVKDIVEFCLPKLHICVTSRLKPDIRDAILPIASHWVSLHDQDGQKDDIMDYVRSVVYSTSELFMRGWEEEEKDLVVKTLSIRADGV